MGEEKDRAFTAAVIFFCIFAYGIIGFGAVLGVDIQKMKIETIEAHLTRRDQGKIMEYIQSVEKIYLTIKTVSPFVGTKRAKKLAPMFKHVSDESNIPVRTCLLIAKVESDFRRIRSANDYGMMQINEFWLNRYDVSPEDAMDDWKNLQIFVRIMKELEDKPLSYYHSWTPSVRVKYERKLDKWATLL